MQKRKRRRSDRAGRPAMRSPGRPPVAGREEQQQRFWKAIARGLSSEDAAVSCGMSPPWVVVGSVRAVVCRRSAWRPRSARYLSFAEREEDRDPESAGRRGARHCPSAPESPVDCLARAASQRGDSERRSGVSGVDCAVAQRPTCHAPEDRQAGRERSGEELRQDARRHDVAEDGTPVPGPNVGSWSGRCYGQAARTDIGRHRGARSRSPIGSG